MATAGSIHIIAAGTALIYQLMILGWLDLIKLVIYVLAFIAEVWRQYVILHHKPQKLLEFLVMVRL